MLGKYVIWIYKQPYDTDLVSWCVALGNFILEPRHDKTNNVVVRPVKTQISLGIRPVWSESSLSAWRNLGSLATHWAHIEDSDQTGPSESSLGAHSFCWFCHVAAHFFVQTMIKEMSGIKK